MSDETSTTEETTPEYPEGTPMIVHRQQFVDSAGTVGEKVHGPMPVSEWAEYERKNNL